FPDENLPYGSIPNQKDYKFESGSYPILFYKYKDYVIWGMTAKILENFLNFLSE
ncbi:coenzyme A pyrophosphatase, partial [Clostridioides difficile]|nr:coenzyme A pyrophosphatase [Clostridioides difficile]